MTVLASCQIFSYMRGSSPLSRQAKMASALLVFTLWMQLSIGVKTIWESVPIHMASAHQIGAMTVLSAFTIAMHTCRRTDMRHLKNLLGKLRTENPKAFDQAMTGFNEKNIHTANYNKLNQQLFHK